MERSQKQDRSIHAVKINKLMQERLIPRQPPKVARGDNTCWSDHGGQGVHVGRWDREAVDPFESFWLIKKTRS